MEQVSVSEFEVACIQLLEQVRRTGEPIAILKDGVPLVVVSPPPIQNRKAAFGALKHTLLGPLGDVITPLDEGDWEALRP